MAAILVVDDNADVAHAVSKVLRSSGHDSRFVLDGMAALDSLAIFPTDLVFLDISMPGTSGLEILETIRSNHQFDGTAVVMYSAFDDPDYRHLAAELGADDYLLKLASMDMLLAMVEKHSPRTIRVKVA